VTATLTLSDQLARIAAEIDLSRDLLSEVEASAGALAAAAGARAPATARTGLQTLDRLDQRLAGLSRWIGVLAAQAPGDPLPAETCRALDAVGLGELRAALGALDAISAGPAAAGTMEMF
jgi:hypothetical protein